MSAWRPRPGLVVASGRPRGHPTNHTHFHSKRHSCLGGDKTWLAASSSLNRLLTHHFLCSPSAAAAMISWRAWSRKWLSCSNIFRCNSVAFFPSVFSTSLPLLSHVSQVLHSRSGLPNPPRSIRLHYLSPSTSAEWM